MENMNLFEVDEELRLRNLARLPEDMRDIFAVGDKVRCKHENSLEQGMQDGTVIYVTRYVVGVKLKYYIVSYSANDYASGTQIVKKDR